MVAGRRMQQLITRFVPRSWAAAMEAESRAWLVRCRACGFEQSIWDLGGIRWKSGGATATWGRCPECGKLGWHEVYRPKPANAPNAK